MNESNLRAMIKSAIAEIVAEAKKTKKKEEEQRTDVSKVRDSAKKFLKNKKIMSEETESESMTLSEWKNDELFGLLTERFISKTLSEKRFGNDKSLDKDGDGIPKWADKDDEDEEVGAEEEELDEAKDLPKKVLKKGHKIGKSIKKSNSDVDNPFAVGMAAAKKEAGIK